MGISISVLLRFLFFFLYMKMVSLWVSLKLNLQIYQKRGGIYRQEGFPEEVPSCFWAWWVSDMLRWTLLVQVCVSKGECLSSVFLKKLPYIVCVLSNEEYSGSLGDLREKWLNVGRNAELEGKKWKSKLLHNWVLNFMESCSEGKHTRLEVAGDKGDGDWNIPVAS